MPNTQQLAPVSPEHQLNIILANQHRQLRVDETTVLQPGTDAHKGFILGVQMALTVVQSKQELQP